jgi:hypothetical protein
MLAAIVAGLLAAGTGSEAIAQVTRTNPTTQPSSGSGYPPTWMPYTPRDLDGRTLPANVLRTQVAYPIVGTAAVVEAPARAYPPTVAEQEKLWGVKFAEGETARMGGVDRSKPPGFYKYSIGLDPLANVDLDPPNTTVVFVSSVTPGGLFDAAGVRAGDMIFGLFSSKVTAWAEPNRVIAGGYGRAATSLFQIDTCSHAIPDVMKGQFGVVISRGALQNTLFMVRDLPRATCKLAEPRAQLNVTLGITNAEPRNPALKYTGMSDPTLVSIIADNRFSELYFESYAKAEDTKIRLELLFPSAIDKYSTLCEASLPPNAVSFTHKTSLYKGQTITPYVITSLYEIVPTYTVRMDPKYLSTYSGITTTIIADIIASWPGTNSTGQTAESLQAYLVRKIVNQVGLSKDVETFFKLNGCKAGDALLTNLQGRVNGKRKVIANGLYPTRTRQDRGGVYLEIASVPDGVVPYVPYDPKFPGTFGVDIERGRTPGELVSIAYFPFNPYILDSRDTLTNAQRERLQEDTPREVRMLECAYVGERGYKTRVRYWYSGAPLPPQSTRDAFAAMNIGIAAACPARKP